MLGLWSGGLDSTYMIQHVLERDKEHPLDEVLQVGYVELANNPEKTKMEKRAIEKMVPYLSKRYGHRFQYLGTLFKAEVRVSGDYQCFSQIPVWVCALVEALQVSHHKILMGYVNGDCASSSTEDIRRLFDAYHGLTYPHYRKPVVEFPLTKYPKTHIVEWIASELFEHVVWCEYPEGRKFKPCGLCQPCKRSPIKVVEGRRVVVEELVRRNSSGNQ